MFRSWFATPTGVIRPAQGEDRRSVTLGNQTNPSIDPNGVVPVVVVWSERPLRGRSSTLSRNPGYRTCGPKPWADRTTSRRLKTSNTEQIYTNKFDAHPMPMSILSAQLAGQERFSLCMMRSRASKNRSSSQGWFLWQIRKRRSMRFAQLQQSVCWAVQLVITRVHQP